MPLSSVILCLNTLELSFTKMIKFRSLLQRTKPITKWSRSAQTGANFTEKDVEEVQIPVPWGHIAGKWWGNKKEVPLLALHGWQDNANSFDKLAPLLNVPSVLALDSIGHGNSSHLPPGRMYSYTDYLLVIRRIVKYFKWQRFSILGHSFGSSIGYTYTSLYPDEVKFLINMDCVRTLVRPYTMDRHFHMSRGLDKLIRIEKTMAEDSSAAYKLSDLVKMYSDGSLGSVSPESAMILLKRGAKPASMNFDIRNKTTKTALEDLVDKKRGSSPMKAAKVRFEQSIPEIRKKMEALAISNPDDYFVLTRDPRVRIIVFGVLNEKILLESAKKIKCPVLNLKAKNGFLYGIDSTVYEKTLKVLKENSSHYQHVEVEGTHHTHLNTPQHVARAINNFLHQIKCVGVYT